jgi:hypothetical protein
MTLAHPRRVAGHEATGVEEPLAPSAHRKELRRAPALGLMAQEGLISAPVDCSRPRDAPRGCRSRAAPPEGLPTQGQVSWVVVRRPLEVLPAHFQLRVVEEHLSLAAGEQASGPGLRPEPGHKLVPQRSQRCHGDQPRVDRVVGVGDELELEAGGFLGAGRPIQLTICRPEYSPPNASSKLPRNDWGVKCVAPRSPRA